MSTNLANAGMALGAIARASPKRKLKANRWSFVVRPNGNVELWIETDDAKDDDLLVTVYENGRVKKQKVLRIIPPSSYYYWG